MMLSILIATVVGREESFNALAEKLSTQYNGLEVEMITEKDNKEISIGAKRQKLLEQAKGKYIVFIDDDDTVSDDYIDSILHAAKNGSDAIGFKIDCTHNGKFNGRAKASSKYKRWGDNINGFRYVRSIYHKTPVLKELAIKAGGFKDIRFGEDHDYSMRVNPLVKTETFIDKVLYYYQYKDEGSHNERYGIK